MGIDSSPDASAADVFQSVWYRSVLLVLAVEVAVLWSVLGPGNPWVALTVAAGTFALGPAVAAPVTPRIPPRWFRVPAHERVLHLLAGVGLFGWLLDVTGWNRHVAGRLRRFSSRKDALHSLEQSVRAGATAHGTCFVIHVLLAALAAGTRHPWSAALWMLLPGVVVHLYPVLLQRALMLRLQPLLEKFDA